MTNTADHSRITRGWYCKLPDGHSGPCPTYPRLWKTVELWVRTGTWYR